MIDKIITVIVALVSVYIGYLLSSRTAKKTIKLQEFNKAASEFYAAFIDAKRRLDKSKSADICHPNSDGVKSILNSSIVNHETAMIKFRSYLKKSKLVSFDNAWKVYYSQKDDNSHRLNEYISKLHNKIKDPEHEEKNKRISIVTHRNIIKFYRNQKHITTVWT